MDNVIEPLRLDDFLTRDARARAEARAQALDVARELLAAITDPVARAVLDLHAVNIAGDCDGCDFFGGDAEPPTWPCRTVTVIAAHYGIALP